MGWMRLDRVMRWLHLYTALFLAPWLLIYASSAFFLNHDEWFQGLFNIIPPGWVVIREEDFKPQEISSSEPELEARAVLDSLDLQGDYRLLEKSNDNRLVVLRYSGGGNYRVTWLRSMDKVIVERHQPSSIYGFLHYLHFSAGYGRQQIASDIWAIIVDLIAISVWLWVISGLYFWIRRRVILNLEIFIFCCGITTLIILASLLYV